jgi:hypothetical protein
MKKSLLSLAFSCFSPSITFFNDTSGHSSSVASLESTTASNTTSTTSSKPKPSYISPSLTFVPSNEIKVPTIMQILDANKAVPKEFYTRDWCRIQQDYYDHDMKFPVTYSSEMQEIVDNARKVLFTFVFYDAFIKFLRRFHGVTGGVLIHVYKEIRGFARVYEQASIICALIPTSEHVVRDSLPRIEHYLTIYYDALYESIFAWEIAVEFKHAHIDIIKTKNESEWFGPLAMSYQNQTSEYLITARKEALSID